LFPPLVDAADALELSQTDRIGLFSPLADAGDALQLSGPLAGRAADARHTNGLCKRQDVAWSHPDAQASVARISGVRLRVTLPGKQLEHSHANFQTAIELVGLT